MEKLQKKYEQLSQEKDDTLEAVKKSGLGLMKAVKAAKMMWTADDVDRDGREPTSIIIVNFFCRLRSISLVGCLTESEHSTAHHASEHIRVLLERTPT